MKKRIVSILLMIAVLTATAFACVPAVSAATGVSDGIAVAFVYFEDASSGMVINSAGYGTCFFVGDTDENPTYAVTNYHVIELYDKCGKGERVTDAPAEIVLDDASKKGKTCTGQAMIYIYFDRSHYVRASVVASDSTKDLAVLKLMDPTSERRALPLRVPTQDFVDDRIPVSAFGYPGSSDSGYVDSDSIWSKSDVTVTSGYISRIHKEPGIGRTLLQLDCEITYGNSGGPLVDDNGAVVGVNTYGFPGDNGKIINYAISAGDVVELLKQNGIPYELSDGKDEGLSTKMLVIIIAGGALVLILILILILVLHGKKKKNQKEKDEMNARIAAAEAAASSQAAQAARAAQAAVSAKPVQNPSVRSLSTQHRGMSVPIGSGQILIGRNKTDCSLVFDASTPGVSGRHCSVSFDMNTGDFILTDLKSTYGTFLQNGQKLTPLVQYRLRSGDRFYVGETGNMIVVELR